jgi:hypothetical protein
MSLLYTRSRTGGRLGSGARPSLGARQGGCVAGIRGPFGTTLTHARCPAAARRSSARRWPTCRTRGPSSRISPRRSGRSRPRPALSARARRGALCAALLRTKRAVTARCRARDRRPAPRGLPPLAARAKDSRADTRGVLRQVAASLVTLPLTALSANPQFLSIAAALGAPPPCPAPAPGIHPGRTPSCPGQCDGVRDAACPISTGRGTRRVRLVRGEGRGVSDSYEGGGQLSRTVRPPPRYEGGFAKSATRRTTCRPRAREEHHAG